MDTRPFILLGETQLSALKSGFETGLRAWAADWFVGPESFSVAALTSFKDSPDIELNENAGWYRLGSNEAASYVQLDALGKRALLAAIFDTDDGEAALRTDDGPSSLLSQDLVQDLAARLLLVEAGAINEGWPTPAPLPEWLSQAGSGAVFLELRLNAARIRWVIHPEAVRKLCLKHNSAIGAERKVLSRVPETLSSETVQVFVGVEAAETLSVETLDGLNIGDVILLDRKVMEPWDLIGQDGIRFASCYLGRRNGLNAVNIAAPVALNAA